MKPSSLIALLALWLAGCATLDLPTGGGPRVEHVVICWLKQPGDTQARQRLIDASEAFDRMPGVLDVKAGAPLKSNRPQVQSDYDVAISMTFRDRAAYEAYLKHPDHKQSVQDVLRPLVKKYVTYDYAVE